MTDPVDDRPICECPKCGRMHRFLAFDPPAQAVLQGVFVRMEAYAARFDDAGKSPHAETIRKWRDDIRAVLGGRP